MKLLYGAPVADHITEQTKAYVSEHPSGYLAIFVCGENHPGMAYVNRKVALGEKLGIEVKLFGNTSEYDNSDALIDAIRNTSADSACGGIIVQLPLPSAFTTDTQRILDAVPAEKDVDGLGSQAIVAPATPLAVLEVLRYYSYDVVGKHIAMVGQSGLIGLPLTKLLRESGAIVETFDINSDPTQMRSICQSSDIIISATGALHLIDETFVRKDISQIIIDVGRGMIDGKPAGDVNSERIAEYVAAMTPVPGGVGPVTVAQLFANMVLLAQRIS